RERTPEEVRADRDQVVLEPEQHGLVAGVLAERRLRDDSVHDDDEREGESERVGGARLEREPPGAQRVAPDAEERDAEENFLPGFDRGERGAVDAGAVERGADGVVDREPDDEEVERAHGAAPDGGTGGEEEDGVESERQRRGHGCEPSGGGAGAPPPRSGLKAPR